VSRAEIFNVDVVSDTGAVFSTVVIAVNGSLGITEGGTDNQRNKVAFGVVVLTEFAVRTGSASVEVPKSDGFEVKLAVKIGQGLFKSEFRQPIRINGGFGVGFGNGYILGSAVNSCSRRENDIFYGVVNHGLEKFKR